MSQGSFCSILYTHRLPLSTFVFVLTTLRAGSKLLCAGSQSDHLVLVSAFDKWHTALVGVPQHTSTAHAAQAQHSTGGKGKHSSKAQQIIDSNTGGSAKAASQVAKQLYMNETVLYELKASEHVDNVRLL